MNGISVSAARSSNWGAAYRYLTTRIATADRAFLMP